MITPGQLLAAWMFSMFTLYPLFGITSRCSSNRKRKIIFGVLAGLVFSGPFLALIGYWLLTGDIALAGGRPSGAIGHSVKHGANGLPLVFLYSIVITHIVGCNAIPEDDLSKKFATKLIPFYCFAFLIVLLQAVVI